jgi:hypothetical protein
MVSKYQSKGKKTGFNYIIVKNKMLINKFHNTLIINKLILLAKITQ